LQNLNLKFGVMPISYTSSNFRQKQQINGQNSAKQVYKICFILSVGLFFCRTLYMWTENSQSRHVSQ